MNASSRPFVLLGKSSRPKSCVLVALVFGGLAVAFGQSQQCLSNYVGSSLTIGSPSNLAWSPHFELTSNSSASGAIATSYSTCPSYYMEQTYRSGGASSGSQVMRLVTRQPLFQLISSLTTQRVSVYDCNDNFLGTVIENEFAFTGVFWWNLYWYTIQDANGNGIGTCNLPTVFTGTMTILDNSGATAGIGTTIWNSNFNPIAFYSLSVSVTYWNPASPAGKPELLLALMNLGLQRAISQYTSSPMRDGCSQFIIVGIPILAIAQLICMGLMVCTHTNKFEAFLASFLLTPLLALWIALLAVLLAFTILYAPVFFLMNGCKCSGQDKGSSAFTPLGLVLAAVCTYVATFVKNIDNCPTVWPTFPNPCCCFGARAGTHNGDNAQTYFGLAEKS